MQITSKQRDLVYCDTEIIFRSTTLCLLHRAHMPPATTENNGQMNGYPTDAAYPSRNIAFQAAGMITSIIEHLQESNELRYTPAFV